MSDTDIQIELLKKLAIKIDAKLKIKLRKAKLKKLDNTEICNE